MAGTAAVTDLHEGMTLDAWPTVVTAERQQRYHAAAEVDSDLFGGLVDLSVLANDTILATRYLKTQAIDGLHAGQRMQQQAPVQLDQPLTLTGRVGAIRPTARGSFVSFDFDFVAADGSVPVRGALISFRVAAAVKDDSGDGGSAGTPPGGALLARKPLSPERVTGYSFEFPDYLVHFDPAVAASVGLRTPVAQGLMSYTWMMEALARRGLPGQFSLDASFRKPIFWDDEARVLADGDNGLLVATARSGICSHGAFAAAT